MPRTNETRSRRLQSGSAEPVAADRREDVSRQRGPVPHGSTNTWRERRDQIQDECVARMNERGERIFLMVDERQAYALAAGFLPKAVQAMARAAVDWEFAPQRKGKRRARR